MTLKAILLNYVCLLYLCKIYVLGCPFLRLFSFYLIIGTPCKVRTLSKQRIVKIPCPTLPNCDATYTFNLFSEVLNV